MVLEAGRRTKIPVWTGDCRRRQKSKIGVALPRIFLTENCEIIECSAKAEGTRFAEQKRMKTNEQEYGSRSSISGSDSSGGAGDGYGSATATGAPATATATSGDGYGDSDGDTAKLPPLRRRYG